MGGPDRQYFSVCMINRSDAARAYYLLFSSAFSTLPSEFLFHCTWFSHPSCHPIFSLPFIIFSGLISWIDSIWVKCTVRGPEAIPSLQPVSISQRWAINLEGVVLFITVNLRNEDALRIREAFMRQD